jgi:indolepyruvate ferredoxin oxidoreductase beta subunit
MSSGTVVYLNTTPIVPYVLAQRAALKRQDAEYPEVESLIRRIRSAAGRTHVFDATQVAIDAGSAGAVNVVMLGSLLGSGMLPCPPEKFWNIARESMPRRAADTNNRAFARGVELARNTGHVETKA